MRPLLREKRAHCFRTSPMSRTRTGGLYDIGPVVAPVEKQPAIFSPRRYADTGRPVTFPHRPNHRDRHRLDISRGPYQGKNRPTPRQRASANTASSPQPHVSVAFLFPANALPPIRKQRIPKTKKTERVHRENDMPCPARPVFVLRPDSAAPNACRRKTE